MTGFIFFAVQLVVTLCAELKESNVNLKLTIVDSIGFGDQIDKTDRYVLLYNSDVTMSNFSFRFDSIFS